MSVFKKLNDKSMKVIMVQIDELFSEEGYDMDELSSFIELYSEIDEICKYFGLENLSFEDYSYLYEIIRLNPTLEPPFNKPILKVYNVEHKEHYTQSGIKWYEQTIESYSDLDSDTLNAMRDHEMYYYYEGTETYDDTGNYESYDDEVGEIKRIK